MPDPRLPRGASLRLAFVVAIAAVLFAPHLARASGRGGQEPARGGAEIVATADVLAEAARWIGQGNMTGKPGPWCADFVSFVLRRSGRAPLAGRMAADALRYGPRLGRPTAGALAVISTPRGWAGHVGIVEGVEPDGSIRLVSGNWGHRVARSLVPRGAVVAFVEVR